MITNFALSRIYADGWKTACALPIDLRDELLATGGAAALNPWPCSKTSEHARWANGFGCALGQDKKSPPSFTSARQTMTDRAAPPGAIAGRVAR
jgi:hypothetical protein